MINKMDCEKESVINRFNTMEEDQKMLIIGLGAEVLAKALTLRALGHTTLKGHCYYIRKNSVSFLDQMFMALNGDNDARNCFNGFADSDYVRETAKSISGQRLEKTNEQVKAQN